MPSDSKNEKMSVNERIEKLERLVEIISKGKYQWESTFDAIAAPVMIVTGDYIIERANYAFAQHCGLDITEVAGRVCYEAFAERDEPCENCPLQYALDANRQGSDVLSSRARKREFECSAYPLVLAEDQPSGAVMSYRDITEERRLQLEVIQNEKMAAIGILAGGVAHEINNPLGGILAFTQLLLKDSRDQNNEELTADLKEIENAAKRCKKIVSDLLDFSRMSKDKEYAPVDVNKLIETVIPFIRSEIKSLNVDLEMDVHEGIPKVLGISNRLQQVFLNLMTNACHAMPKGGNLKLTTNVTRDGQRIMVRVVDTGEGIPGDIQDRIFDPFFTTKMPGKGTGLGLSISYRIIREHGGTIEVESDEGRGATFTIMLPVADD